MYKKLITSLLIFIMIISISMIGYAANIDQSKYEVITPNENLSSSKKGIVLISGKSPKGIDVVIEVYRAIDLTGKKYSLSNLPEDQDYTLVSTKEKESGVAGFAEEVELVFGINKIIVDFGIDEVSPVEKVIYYYEREQMAETLKHPNILNTAE